MANISVWHLLWKLPWIIMIFWSGGDRTSVCIKCSFVCLCLSCKKRYFLHVKNMRGKGKNNGIRKVKRNVGLGLEDQVEKYVDWQQTLKTLKTYYCRHFLKYTHMHIQMEFLYNNGTMPHADTIDYQINRVHAMYGCLFLSSWQWDAIGHKSIKYCCCSCLLTITLW